MHVGGFARRWAVAGTCRLSPLRESEAQASLRAWSRCAVSSADHRHVYGRVNAQHRTDSKRQRRAHELRCTSAARGGPGRRAGRRRAGNHAVVFTWRYAFSDWRTEVHGDVAWTTFRDRAVLTPQKGAPVPFDWWETVVLTKVDGAWLIDRYQSAPVRK
jgi:hypothetical protein